MLADLVSPLIIACCGIAISFKRFASIRRCCGVSSKPFNSPPHCEEARPVDVDRVNFLYFDKRDTPRRCFFFISFARTSREVKSSFFKSSIPVMRVPGFKITAAAETGPASRLIPASSTPATASCPLSQRSVSKRSILRSRCPSDRFSKRRFAIEARIARAPARLSARKISSSARLKWPALNDVALT